MRQHGNYAESLRPKSLPECRAGPRVAAAGGAASCQLAGLRPKDAGGCPGPRHARQEPNSGALRR